MLIQVLLTVSNCVVWTINSLSFWQVGIVMPDYPIFANWIGITPYLFIIPFIYCKFVSPFKEGKKHLLFIACAFLSTIDSVLEILADPHTGGVVQAICSAAIPIPLTGLLTWLVFKRKLKLFETIGSVTVILAAFLMIFESEGIYVDWWIVAFIIGLSAGSVYSVIWEWMFIKYDISVMQLMAWTTLYSVPFYFLSIFVDGSNVWTSERNGFRCLFEMQPLPGGCLSNAWIPVLVYALSSMASDIIQMYFVKNDSAYFLIIVDTLTTPLTSIIMSFHFIFGDSTEPLTWYSIIACILVVVGILVYKMGDAIMQKMHLRQNTDAESIHFIQ